MEGGQFDFQILPYFATVLIMVDLIQMSGGENEELEPLSENTQGPVEMELMCLSSYGDPETWAHSDAIMHFGHGKIRGRDIVPHVEKQLRYMREFLQAEVAAGRPAFTEAQVEDLFEGWIIRYELSADGTISKLYINVYVPENSAIVSLDTSDTMKLPARRAEGEGLALLGGSAAIAEALRAKIEGALGREEE